MKSKICLILLSLGLVSGSAYASHEDEMIVTSTAAPNDINVTAPDQSGMWSFGGTAVLMQPTKAFDYADASSLFADSAGKSVSGEYDWWYGADITYAFPGNGRDVTLAYEGLRSTDTDSTSLVNSSFTELPYLTAGGKAQANYDAGDLLFGQKIDVGTRVRLHPFMGLRYARIETKDTAGYGGGVADTTNFSTSSYATESSELKNTFHGIGPRFGSDAQVNLSQGFSVRGRLGLSTLIGSPSGTNSSVITYYDPANVALGQVGTSHNSNSNTQIIPEVDGRLGLNYTFNLNNSNSALGFEAGWQAINYFNVGATQDTSNFGMQGPYARIQLDLA